MTVALAMNEAHGAWVLRQVADGVDGPVPAGRKSGSDYNQHFADMEAPSAAQDEVHNRLRALAGLLPLAPMVGA